MTTKHEAALRALDHEMNTYMAVWIEGGDILPDDEARRWKLRMAGAELSLLAAMREHWPTIRDALTAQGERVAEGCDCSFGDTCSCAYDCRCRAELKHLREEGGELINTGLRLVALEAPAPSAPPAECPNCGEPGDERYWKRHFHEGEWLCPQTPVHSADTEVR